jgi:hypothetical protein
MLHQKRNDNEVAQNLMRKAMDKAGMDDDGTGSSKRSKYLIDHEEHSSYPDVDKVNKLLRDFKPEELIQKPTAREKIQTFLLRVKAVIPLFVSLSMIYLIFGVYMMTYIVPLIFDHFNDHTYFFYDDKDKIPGMRKLPKTFHCLLGGFTVIMF